MPARSTALLLLGTLGCLCAAHAAFLLPPLPFPSDATEPVITAQANEYHRNNHHKQYVDKTNEAVAGDAKLEGKSLTELVSLVGTGKLPKDKETTIRNQGGGAWNHNLWWRILAPYEAPETQTSAISDDLHEAIQGEWGSVDKMVEEFSSKAKALFGSGWTWLVVKKDNKLGIITTSNQDNPLMSLEEDGGIPIFGMDVWEHAFYLSYGPTKPKYVDNFWKLVNWPQVSKHYTAALKGDYDGIIGREYNTYKQEK